MFDCHDHQLSNWAFTSFLEKFLTNQRSVVILTNFSTNQSSVYWPTSQYWNSNDSQPCALEFVAFFQTLKMKNLMKTHWIFKKVNKFKIRVTYFTKSNDLYQPEKLFLWFLKLQGCLLFWSEINPSKSGKSQN